MRLIIWDCISLDKLQPLYPHLYFINEDNSWIRVDQDFDDRIDTWEPNTSVEFNESLENDNSVIIL